jgi:hypothetical protein
MRFIILVSNLKEISPSVNQIVELNKNIDRFYMKMTQKGGFSKLCVKIKKRCYTDLLHFSTQRINTKNKIL